VLRRVFRKGKRASNDRVNKMRKKCRTPRTKAERDREKKEQGDMHTKWKEHNDDKH